MNIEYRIDEFPSSPKGYRLITDTQGELSFTIAQARYLVVQDALIMEFARYACSWLRAACAGEWPDFYYASMDEEEEPIIAFTLHEQDYRVSSCWSENDAPPMPREQVRDAVAKFLQTLERELKQQHDLDLAAELVRHG